MYIGKINRLPLSDQPQPSSGQRLITLLHQVISVGAPDGISSTTPCDPWVHVAYLNDENQSDSDLDYPTKKILCGSFEKHAQDYSSVHAHDLKSAFITHSDSQQCFSTVGPDFFSTLVYFLNHNEIVAFVRHALRKGPYSIIRNSQGLVICHDQLRLEIKFSSLIVAMIIADKSMHHILLDITSQLALRFKHCELIATYFNEHYPQELTSQNGRLGLNTEKGHFELDYQNISEVFVDRQDLHSFLAASDPLDLINYGGLPVLTVRSPIHQIAQADTRHIKHSGYCLCYDMEINGRLTPASHGQHQLIQRYHQVLATKNMHQRKFHARVIVGHEVRATGFFFLGDKIASVLSDPHLVAGLLRAVGAQTEQSWHASSVHEDMVLLTPETTPKYKLGRLKKFGKCLSAAVLPEGADPLTLELLVAAQTIPIGSFELNAVPSEFFELMRVIEQKNHTVAPPKQHYLRGLALELVREWHQASLSFMRAFKLERSNPDICFALGRTLHQDRKSDEAIFFLRQAQQLSPNRPDIANLLGLNYLDKNSLDEALIALELAVSLSPAEPQYLTDLARCYFLSGALNECKSALQNVLAHTPNSHEAHLLLAEINYQQKNYDHALSHALEASDAYPGDEKIADLLSKLDKIEDLKPRE